MTRIVKVGVVLDDPWTGKVVVADWAFAADSYEEEIQLDDLRAVSEQAAQLACLPVRGEP